MSGIKKNGPRIKRLQCSKEIGRLLLSLLSSADYGSVCIRNRISFYALSVIVESLFQVDDDF
jgi:hypothetical protein